MRRVVWAFAGQGLSSGSNVVVTLLVLSTSSPHEFATFSLCITTYLCLVELTRAAVSVPLSILYSGEPARRDADGERSAVGLVVVLGVAFSLVLAAIGAYTGGGALFVALACFLPLLVAEDALRYVAFAAARPSAAAYADGCWLFLQLAASAVAFLTGRATMLSLFCIWATAGVLGAAVLALQLRLVPRFQGAVRWLGQHWALSRRLTVEFFCTHGCYYSMFYGLALVAGSLEFGRLKGAQILLGPMTVLILGAVALSVPESVRARADADRLRRFAARISLFLMVMALACGAVVFIALPWFGPRLFADNWATARPLVPLLALYTAALGAWTGPIAGLRALDDISWIVRARAASSAFVLLGGLIASSMLGASGAVLSMIVGELSLAAVAWSRFQRQLYLVSTPGLISADALS